MKLKRDQITGALLVLIGIIVAFMTSSFSVPFSMSYPGPKALPMIAVIGFIVCGAGIFVESTKSNKEEKVFLVKEGWIRVIVSTVILAVYILAMKYVGYLIATPVICYILTTLYAKGSKSTLKGRLIYTILLTAIIYAVYVYAFGLGVPTGELFG
ncbi:tripartite tricarboxylate transporter TctB family protein [Ventrimonas sp. CLA-AP-H27]|uniref:Tripartite tricarboxylate transporter TctB family protein n=1 Tax=Ventrimonas faecis TaxID=3133170 RepID=A0ABV1HP66_9FIRM